MPLEPSPPDCSHILPQVRSVSVGRPFAWLEAGWAGAAR